MPESPLFNGYGPYSTRWDVYRDAGGDPVTVTDCSYGFRDPEALPLTDEQAAAVRHAVKVWHEVCNAEGSSQNQQLTHEDGKANWNAGVLGMGKSALLARMIHDGKPPHDVRPPLAHSGGWWQVIEHGYALIGNHFVHGPHPMEPAYRPWPWVGIYQHGWEVLDDSDGLILRLAHYDEPWKLRPAMMAEVEAHHDPKYADDSPWWWLERAS